MRQSKTGAGVTLLVGLVPLLADRLPAATTIIVSEETGLPYKPDNFRHVFSAIRARAAQDHRSFDVDHLLPVRDMADPDAFRIHCRT